MRSLLICSTCLLVSPTLLAQSFNYTFVEIGYSDYSLEQPRTDLDADGFTIASSFALNQNFHIFGDFAEAEVKNTNLDAEAWQLGLGYNSGLSDNVDLIVSGALFNRHIALGRNRSVELDGFVLGTSLRIWMTDRLELDLGLDLLEFKNAGEDMAMNAGLGFSLTESLVLNLGGQWSDSPEITELSLGLRWYFSI